MYGYYGRGYTPRSAACHQLIEFDVFRYAADAICGHLRLIYNVRKQIFSDSIECPDMMQAMVPCANHELVEQPVFDKAAAIVLDTRSPSRRRVCHRT